MSARALKRPRARVVALRPSSARVGLAAALARAVDNECQHRRRLGVAVRLPRTRGASDLEALCRALDALGLMVTTVCLDLGPRRP